MIKVTKNLVGSCSLF